MRLPDLFLRRRFFFPVATALVLAGCNTTQQQIRKNEALFESFPPEIQEKIRQGQVEIGFTKDMVQVALGKPDRRFLRNTTSGESQIWSYVDFQRTPERQRVEGTFRVRDSRRGFMTVNDSIWVDVDRHYEFDRRRIEFKDGKVVAIEDVLDKAPAFF